MDEKKEIKMRILFVGMPDSVHTARWVSQIVDEGWEIYLFPSLKGVLRPEFRNIHLFSPAIVYRINKSQNIHYIKWTGFFLSLDKIVERLIKTPFSSFGEWAFKTVILFLRPDIIHSLEIQHAGYQTLKVQERFRSKFPIWIVTNWGSDIFLFGRLFEHKERIKAVLANCDYYSCECQRDIALAQKYGYSGKVLPVLPNAGGYDLRKIAHLREKGLVSSRRVILLKGYQHWAGRALVGIRALTICADALKGYRVAIFSAENDVGISARLFQHDTGIPVEFISNCSHEEMLRWYGRSRIYIGLSISDAISTSMLEALVMGAFPIQSDTSCGNEWIESGVNGFIVPAEDPEFVAQAIREAVRNDALVEGADRLNQKIAEERLDVHVIKPQVIQMYKDILVDRGQ